MGTTVHSVSESSPQVSSLTSHHQQTKWLNSVSRRRKLTPSISPSMSTTSRETARSMLSTSVTSSAPPTSTLPSRPRLKKEEWGRTFQNNVILSLQNTKLNVAVTLQASSQPQVKKKYLFCDS